MKVIKVLGWIIIPYIMILIFWKKIGKPGKVAGIIYSLIIIISAIVNGNNGGSTDTASASKKHAQSVESASTKSSTTASTSVKTTTKTTTPSKPVAPSKTASSQTTSDNGVLTKEKYDKIQNGMTYDQVVQIIGSKGDLESETGQKGTQFYTVMYSFKADGDFGANANFMFQGGKLINKAQFGLGGDSNVTINLAKFSQIQNGMTYEQVQKIVGGEGQILSETGTKGSTDYTIVVEYNGDGGLGANANFMFQGDKLQSKSQFGL